jgi:FkbM family methyltransferase
MAIANRVGLFAGYFSKERNFPVSFPEVITAGFLQKAAAQVGPTYVESITDRGALEEVWLRGITDPLYWPKSISHWELHKSCADCLYPPIWHHYEVPETTVEAGETVVDCGAAEGVFALSVLRRAAKVAIFEPWKGFRESLRATFGERAVIREQALGSSVHTARLSGADLYGIVNDSEGDPVSVTTLDAFRSEFGPVNYIKADVEGAEHDLLAGAKETILADRPKMALTVYHEPNDWEYMLRMVRSVVPQYQYRVKGLSYNGGKPRPVMMHLWV